MKKCLIAMAAALTVQAHAAFYVENGVIKAEVQTYSRNNQKIVLIDMVHVGPRDFYKDVSRHLRQYEGSNSIVLQEGVRHCERKGDVTILPGPQANFAALEKLYEQRMVLTHSASREFLLKAGFVERVCQADSSNEQPGLISRIAGRFSMYGLIAGLGFLRSQGTIANLYPKNVLVGSGDIATARFENPVEKAAAGAVVQCLLSVKAEGGCIPFKEWAKTDSSKKIQDEIIVQKRNDVLLGTTFNALAISSPFGSDYEFDRDGARYNTVILPWGAAHMPGGLLKAIESMGFTKASKEGIEYTSCERLNRNVILKNIFADDEAIKEGCK